MKYFCNYSSRSEDHVAILTYWRSFEQHEASHTGHIFMAKFDAMGEFCADIHEIGYEKKTRASRR